MPGLMNGLISTLPVSPPPVVGRVALNSGSGVCPGARSDGSPSALSVMLLTGPVGSTGLPSCPTSWNDPVVTEPVFVVGNSGPVLVTAPTKEFAGMLVPVTARPVSLAQDRVVRDDVGPGAAGDGVGPGARRAARAAAHDAGHAVAGTSVGLVWVHTGGRSTKALLPGPG